MLAQMENFDGDFIATTNLMDNLDKASLRRFDLKLEFDYLQPEQDDILLLNSIKDLNHIDKVLIGNNNHDAFIDASWYLTKEKTELFSNKRLRVLSCTNY